MYIHRDTVKQCNRHQQHNTPLIFNTKKHYLVLWNTDHSLQSQFHLLSISLQQQGLQVSNSDHLLLRHHQDH